MKNVMTPQQRQQILRIGTAALEQVLAKGELSSEEADRVIGNSSLGIGFLSETAAEFVECSRYDVKAEIQRVDLSRQYYSGFEKPKGLAEQGDLLRTALPGLGVPNPEYQAKIERGEITLPKHAEGWFCIPNWIKHPEIFGENYSSAVRKILDLLKRTRQGDFYNFRKDQIVEAYLRQSKRSIAFFQTLSDVQGNPDVFIVPAQLGLRHRGKSVLRVRVVSESNEVGLGAFSVGCMLFTHPNRLADEDDLGVDCPGDEFAPLLKGGHTEAPQFLVQGYEFEFCTQRVRESRIDSGSATAFLPE